MVYDAKKCKKMALLIFSFTLMKKKLNETVCTLKWIILLDINKTHLGPYPSKQFNFMYDIHFFIWVYSQIYLHIYSHTRITTDCQIRHPYADTTSARATIITSMDINTIARRHHDAFFRRRLIEEIIPAKV